MNDEARTVPPGHADDLLPLIAIGIATADDRLIAERHIVNCRRCREELGAFEAAAEALLLHDLRAPGPGLWESIERSLPELSERQPQRVSRGPRWLWWGSVAAAVILGLLAGASLTLLAEYQDQPSPLESIQRIQTDDAVFTLAALSTDSTAAGRIFMNEARTEGVVAVTGLPSLPSGERYAVWIVRDDDIRIPAGTFDVDSEGSAVSALAVPDLQYDWTTSGRYVALSISRIRAETPGTPVGGPILIGPLY
ncbi:MAG: anti-sigma factor [Dehalococcoidia bacterium]